LKIPQNPDTFFTSNKLLNGVHQKMYQILIRLLSFLFVITLAIFKSKDNLVLENLALRQQLPAYHTKKKKPRLAEYFLRNKAVLALGIICLGIKHRIFSC